MYSSQTFDEVNFENFMMNKKKFSRKNLFVSF